jgi:DNA-binding response OmpR family regulator
MNDASTATTILLVEHHLPLANAVIRGLAEEGIDVHLAQTDVDAEARALSTPYALLVVDWHLPRQGGAALVRRWRQAGINTPVLMLLPWANGADVVEASLAGADDFLPLPFSFGDLLMRVRSWIKPRTQECEVQSELAGPVGV